MPERIEEILRAIHVLFSKGEMYHELQDKVVLPKREMFSLLEQLNVAVVDVMDRYEATTRSKQKALKELQEAGERIKEAANKEAEDIYAASILYTDGALNEITNIVDATRQRLRDEYACFEECMNQQLEQVKSNQEELLGRLQLLQQNKKYLDIINEFTTKQEAAQAPVQTETKKGKGSKKKDFAQEAVIPERFKKNTKESSPEHATTRDNPMQIRTDSQDEEWETMQEMPAIPARQKVEVKVHTGGGIPENSIFNEHLVKTKKDRKREEKGVRQRENSGDEVILSPEDFDENKEIPFFSSEQLDAEHEQWQQEQASQTERKPERGLGGLFGRKKTKH